MHQKYPTTAWAKWASMEVGTNQQSVSEAAIPAHRVLIKTKEIISVFTRGTASIGKFGFQNFFSSCPFEYTSPSLFGNGESVGMLEHLQVTTGCLFPPPSFQALRPRLLFIPVGQGREDTETVPSGNNLPLLLPPAPFITHVPLTWNFNNKRNFNSAN